ncbi:hypothetical protein [Pseudonocardia lacus]|uniref:hypothetical protein n=1 Tax=Pseudonocardia lacus TaxID=2835865 RepID=UPI001BDDABDC|nr:hypothetical protein [Pseudonocardia lacus]
MGPSQHAGDVKYNRYPELGVLQLECTALEVSGDDQHLLVYSAPPAPARPRRWRCCGWWGCSGWAATRPRRARR